VGLGVGEDLEQRGIGTALNEKQKTVARWVLANKPRTRGGLWENQENLVVDSEVKEWQREMVKNEKKITGKREQTRGINPKKETLNILSQLSPEETKWSRSRVT